MNFMKLSEFHHILAAILILTIITSFSFALNSQWENVVKSLIFSAIIISLSAVSKKIAAHLLDMGVEQEIWQIRHYGLLPPYIRLKRPLPIGIILSIILSLLTLGRLKFSAILTFEARALKYRASKRFGPYSFTEITDWHNGLIGAASTSCLLLLSLIAYFLPGSNLEYLAKISAYYVFWNLLPISKLDGSQIFFGSRILWAILTTISAIFVFLAVTLI